MEVSAATVAVGEPVARAGSAVKAVPSLVLPKGTTGGTASSSAFFFFFGVPFLAFFAFVGGTTTTLAFLLRSAELLPLSLRLPSFTSGESEPATTLRVLLLRVFIMMALIGTDTGTDLDLKIGVICIVEWKQRMKLKQRMELEIRRLQRWLFKGGTRTVYTGMLRHCKFTHGKECS